jgi:hypothetical protein
VSRSRDPDPVADDVEIVDAVPVADDEPRRPVSAPRPVAAPGATVEAATSRLPSRGAVPVAAQAAAVAVTGFAAGAVTAAVVRSASKRRAVKAAKRSPAAGLPVLGTRTFLVDVHLLGSRD